MIGIIVKDTRDYDKIKEREKKLQEETKQSGLHDEQDYEKMKRVALKADIVENYETLYPHLMDKVNVPELKLAVGRSEKETARRQEYVSDLKKVFSRLLKVNSKEQYS